MGEYIHDTETGMIRNSDTGNGCPNCEALACRLRRLDFAIIDVTLYLNVYPDCTEAAEMLCRLRAEREEVADKYVKKCGSLTMFDGGRTPRYQPWEYGGCCR